MQLAISPFCLHSIVFLTFSVLNQSAADASRFVMYVEYRHGNQFTRETTMGFAGTVVNGKKLLVKLQ